MNTGNYNEKVAELRELQKSAVQARDIASRLLESKTDPTDEDKTAIARGLEDSARAAELAAEVKALAEETGAIGRLRKMAEVDAGAEDGFAYLGKQANAAQGIVKAMSTAGGATYGQKALVTAGDIYASVPLLSASPFSNPRPPATLIEALPFQNVAGPLVRYLRQTTRTNNAAPVAEGGVKPTSVYTVSQVDGSLHVIAHISEAIDEYMVEDNASLLGFVQAEMVHGLYQAVEDQVLNGTGTAPALTGIKNTSGVQIQAFSSDMWLTTRAAVTKVEVLGYSPQFFVMHPSDWEKFETGAFSSGNYILNAEGRGNLPVDAAARRLWGIPVVTSVKQAANDALLVSSNSIRLLGDGKLKTVTTNAMNDDFSRNHLRMRVESRFELAVTAPAGVVLIDLTSV